MQSSRTSLLGILSGIALLLVSCSQPRVKPAGTELIFPGEKYFKNLRQLTDGGTNAEAYWSFDGKWLSFQRKVAGAEDCDQIYTMRPDGSDMHRVSNGKGRTTCAFYFPDNQRILFASTHAADDHCPANPDMSKGYVWPIYDTYQFYSAKQNGSDLIPLEPGAPKAYNAEAVACHDGSVVFTSDRDGDLDLYIGKLDPMGTLGGIKKITNTLGYDGGAVFSKDCKKIAWRASRMKPGKEEADYRALLKQHLVRPTQLEIYVANADGTHARQITTVGAASFAPEFTPDGKSVIFASNPRDPRGRKFDLYRVRVDGTRLERITFSDSFESFANFSPDGKYFAFSSNRNAKSPRETNVFVAEWSEEAAATTESGDNPTDRFMTMIETLSAPSMEGRGVGTEGLKKAQGYVAAEFSKIGLKPFKGMDGFLQKVDFKPEKSRPEPAVSYNVVGAWGQGCGKVRPVMIGAHLDHLGHGAENSLEPTKKGIHPGADDNASGVAGVLEIARIIASHSELEKASCFVFAAFTGEELGIVGSSRLAEWFKKSKTPLKAMLNLDMVGRMENNVLTVFGTDSAKEWKDLVQSECADHALSCPGGGDGYGPSDHMAFYISHVPVLHFFTGPHVDYHRTSDTAEKINATGGVQAARLIAALALKTADPKMALHYKKATEAPNVNLMGRRRTSNGAYLGTIPDYSALSSPHGPGGGGLPGGGIRLAGTRPGSPADQAGVKEGDILTSIDTQKIASLDDFMNVLVKLTPGQKIEIGIRRGDSTLKLQATVGKKE